MYPQYVPKKGPQLSSMLFKCVLIASPIRPQWVPNVSPMRPQYIPNASPNVSPMRLQLLSQMRLQCVPNVSPIVPIASPMGHQCTSNASQMHPHFVPYTSPMRPQWTSNASLMRPQWTSNASQNAS